MPPVLGPLSPSSRALWSWEVARGRISLPSVITMKLASSPARHSSMTTRLPASPKDFPESMPPTASKASTRVSAMTTPFPAASPSALMTMGRPFSRIKALAGSISVKVRYQAVGMWCRARKSLVNALEPSSFAAVCVGPKQGSPASRKASARPMTRGASGPTTVRPTASFRAKLTSPSISVALMETFSTFFSRAVPPFPGVTKTRFTRSDRAIFHARACSLPPLPIIRMFISLKLLSYVYGSLKNARFAKGGRDQKPGLLRPHCCYCLDSD